MESPLGYADAKPGETFLKIGVGELEKPKEDRYSFARKYRIVKPAAWKETRRDLEGKNSGPEIRWEMQASLGSGYSYRYVKFVRLGGFDGTRSSLWLGHWLDNTGTKPIRTDFYNHNFLNVDRDPIGPNYRFIFPFDLKAKDLRGRFGELVAVEGKELRFKDKLTDGFVMAGLTGFNPKSHYEDWGFEMRHAPSGIRVHAEWNYPYAKFNIWGVKTTICPEPFQEIKVNPRGVLQWDISYEFAHEPPKK